MYASPFLRDFAASLPLTEAERAALMQLSRPMRLARGEYLLQAGQVCKKIYLVESGIFRNFYLQGDKEITTYFTFEGDFVGSSYSLFSQSPSFEYLQAIEDAQVVAMNYQEIEALYRKSHAFSEFGRQIMQQYLIETEKRVASLLFQSAKQRYEALLQEQPQVIQRVPLGYIASYLGITQETLSRIRAER